MRRIQSGRGWRPFEFPCIVRPMFCGSMNIPAVTALALLMAIGGAFPLFANDGPETAGSGKSEISRPRLNMAAGVKALQDKDYRAAVALLVEAVKSEQLNRMDLSDSYYFLGRALTRVREELLALEQFKRAVQVNPENVKARRMFCRALTQRGKVLAAARHCEASIKLAPEDWRGYFTRALLQQVSGDFDGARDDFTTAYDLAPETIRENVFVVKTLQRAGVLESGGPDADPFADWIEADQ